MAGDAIWIEILPELSGFGKALGSGAEKAAGDAGKRAGGAFSGLFDRAVGAGVADDQVKKLEAAAKRGEKAVESATQGIAKARAAERDAAAKTAEAEGKLADARAKYGDSSKQAEAAALRLEAAQERQAEASRKTETAVKGLKAAHEQAADSAKELGDATKDSADKGEKSGGVWGGLKDRFAGVAGGGGIGKVVGALGGLAAAAGASMAVADQLGKAWEQAWDQAGATAKVGVALDLTAEQASRVGDAASDLWRRGFGADVGEATAAVGSVISSIGGLGDASVETLDDVTSRAMGFADVFDQDVSEAARNAGILIETGLAADAVNAFDLMTASLQQVPEALRGEVMDATQEYSQFFAQLGFDGETAMGMLAAASKDGQYAIDKTGDSLKEFTIRSTDMSTASVAAYDTLGLSAQDMASQILAGGDSAQGAFGTIVDSLLGIEDPALQANTAIALFGTPLEDLGTDKIPEFLQSLSGAGAGLGDVGDKSLAAADAVEAAQSPIDSLQNSLTTTIAEGLEPFVEPAERISKWAQDNPGAMQAVVTVLGVLAAAFAVAAVAVGIFMLVSSPITLTVALIAAGVALLVAGIIILAKNWDEIWAGIKAVTQTVGDWFAGPFAAFFVGIWDAITGAFSAAGSAIAGVFQGLWDWVAGVFSALWGGLVAIFAGPINTVLGIIEVFAAAGLMVLQAAWDGIVAGATWLWDQNVAIWTAISGFLQPYIEALTGFVSEKWSALVNGVTTAVGWLRDQLTAIWTTISDGVRGIVQPLVDWAVGAFSGLRDRAVEIFGDLKTKVTAVFEGLKSGIATVWDGIKAVFSAPVRWVIDIVVNPLIRGFNKLADKVGMPQNKLDEWKFEGFRSGGVLPGYTPYAQGDDVLVPMRRGEGVYVSEAMRDPYERQRLQAVNAAALRGGPAAVRDLQATERRNYRGGLAAGGIVWPTNTRALSGNYSGHTGVDIAAAGGAPVYAMTPGPVTYSGWGRGFGLAVFQRLVGGMEAVYGHLSQALVSTGQQLAGGQLLGRVGSTGNSTGNHLHVEVTATGALGGAQNRSGTLSFLNGADVSGVTDSGGGLGFDLFGAIEDAFSGPLSKLRELGDSGFGGLVKQIPGRIVEGMKSKLTAVWNGITGAVSGVAAGPLKAMAKQMLEARGWSQHWGSLEKLVQGESSWNPLAKNPSSGAYGLPQALPGSKMAAAGWDWRTNPATQLRWMLDHHIPAMGYGNPTGAYNKWLSRSPHWYDEGGELPPGLTVAYNGTDKTEAILTAEQWGTAAAAIRSVASRDGQAGGSEQVTARDLERAVERGTRRALDTADVAVVRKPDYSLIGAGV